MGFRGVHSWLREARRRGVNPNDGLPPRLNIHPGAMLVVPRPWVVNGQPGGHEQDPLADPVHPHNVLEAPPEVKQEEPAPQVQHQVAAAPHRIPDPVPDSCEEWPSEEDSEEVEGGYPEMSAFENDWMDEEHDGGSSEAE